MAPAPASPSPALRKAAAAWTLTRATLLAAAVAGWHPAWAWDRPAEEEIARMTRNMRRALKLTPIELSADRIMPGERVHARCGLRNSEVEDLVLRPNYEEGMRVTLGGGQWWIERMGNDNTIESGSARRGRQYAQGGGIIFLSLMGNEGGRDGRMATLQRGGLDVLAHGETQWDATYLDAARLAAGTYELTYEHKDDLGNVLATRKARFTVLPR